VIEVTALLLLSMLLLTILLSVIVYMVTNVAVIILFFLFMLEFCVMALSYFVTVFFCDLPFRAFFRLPCG